MTGLVTSLSEALQSQFASGVLVMSLVGAAFALCRNAPAALFRVLQRQVVVSVDVVGGDPLFAWLSVWLDAQPYSQRTRILAASAKPEAEGARNAKPSGEAPEAAQILVTPAPGQHLFWYRGRPVWLSRERKDIASTNGDYAGYRETMTVRTLGRSQASVRRLLEEARAYANRDDRKVGVYIARYGDWMRAREMPKRALESVVLPAGVMEALAADGEAFLSQREWYEERGIPWRRGYLLEGPPGTGKTSAITALAAHLRIDLYICPVSDRNISDERLMSTLLGVPQRSAVLLEDVDGVVLGREMVADSGVTFSGLLNALDGVAARPGVMTFLTTNHPERLDPALIRSGRIDVRRHFGLATAEQGTRLFERFYGAGDSLSAERFGTATAGRSMAEIQSILMDHRDDRAAAVRSVALSLSEAQHRREA